MTNNDAAKKFNELRSRGRLIYLVYGLGLTAGLILLLLRQYKFALAAFLLVVLLYLFIVRPIIKQYTEQWREYCVRRFTETHFSPVEYTYAGKAKDIPGLWEHPQLPISQKNAGGLLVRNIARCGHDKVPAVITDATIPVEEGKRVNFLSGAWMSFPFETGVGETVRTVKGPIMMAGLYAEHLASEGWKACSMGNRMNDDIAVCTKSGECELHKEVLACLRRLVNVPNKECIVDIAPDGLYVFVPHRLINKRPPALRYNITPEWLETIDFPEIDEAYLLALTLYNEHQQAVQEKQN
ncbi:MAG: hypothetical protein Q4C54_08825 [Clostridia bacterium]|nr:hypothetical protein [Clostridia bacterium]